VSGKHIKFMDGRVIDFDDENEIRYWIKYLDTTKDELFAAVSAVGASAQHVAQYLANKRGGQQASS
jgi:hypothetical protein